MMMIQDNHCNFMSTKRRKTTVPSPCALVVPFRQSASKIVALTRARMSDMSGVGVLRPKKSKTSVLAEAQHLVVNER